MHHKTKGLARKCKAWDLILITGGIQCSNCLQTEMKKCDSCEQLTINGVVCHETGCPKTPKECKECGDMFVPAFGKSFEIYCDNCITWED